MKDSRFPNLNNNQIKFVLSYGTLIDYPVNEKIISMGDRNYDMYIVISGSIVVKDPRKETVVVEHDKYQFAGDSGMLSGRAAYFDAFAKANSQLLRVSKNDFRELIAKNTQMSDLFLSAFLQRQNVVLNTFEGGLRVLGSKKSKQTYEILDFLDRNHIWYSFLDVEGSEEAINLLEAFGKDTDDLPILFNDKSETLIKPSVNRLAEYLGLLSAIEDKLYDVLVVGAGPAGLASSVYAASEGLKVAVIDKKAPGGQAGMSSKIENYLGFPTGISGGELANNAYIQAQKFGCHISIPLSAKHIESQDGYFLTTTDEGQLIKSRTIVASTGARYSKLPISNISDYEGCGVYYSASGTSASYCKNQIVGVVGGGNSAGQAALFLAEYAKEVHVLLRSGDLGAKMSDYLVQRLQDTENITINLHTEVTALYGKSSLEQVELTINGSDKTKFPISNLFTFIGALPCTSWITNFVDADEKGFILTGSDVPIDRNSSNIPQALETSISGIFAVGDLRKGSVKRVASAVGEGSVAVSQIHRHIALLKIEND